MARTKRNCQSIAPKEQSSVPDAYEPSLAAIIGVTAPVTIFTMSIVIPSRTLCIQEKGFWADLAGDSVSGQCSVEFGKCGSLGVTHFHSAEAEETTFGRGFGRLGGDVFEPGAETWRIVWGLGG